MRALRTGIVALIVTGFATSTFAGDLQQSIAKAVEQQPQERAPSKSSASKPLVWAGSALFVGGMALGLYSFINNQNGGFAEFGEADAVNLRDLVRREAGSRLDGEMRLGVGAQQIAGVVVLRARIRAKEQQRGRFLLADEHDSVDSRRLAKARPMR